MTQKMNVGLLTSAIAAHLKDSFPDEGELRHWTGRSIGAAAISTEKGEITIEFDDHSSFTIKVTQDVLGH